MTGFKKDGPINPGEISYQMFAPSKYLCQKKQPQNHQSNKPQTSHYNYWLYQKIAVVHGSSKSKRKPAINLLAVRISDPDVLQQFEEKKEEKQVIEQEKVRKRKKRELEKEAKQSERLEKKRERLEKR